MVDHNPSTLQSSPGKLDTLLPGYTSRPFPSPRKRTSCRAEQSLRPQCLDGEEEGGARHLSDAAPSSHTVPDLDPGVLVSFPLPPILQRLEESFCLIAVHYEFLVKRHIRPTLKALCSAIEASVGNSAPISQDLRLISMLCPHIVRFESGGRWNDQNDVSAIIALADPKLHKDVTNGIPAIFIETVEASRRKRCEKQTEPKVNGTLNNGEKKRESRPRPNKFTRMAWCLRVAGLRAVISIQAEVVKNKNAVQGDIELFTGQWNSAFSLTEDVNRESLAQFLMSHEIKDRMPDLKATGKMRKRGTMHGKAPAPPRLFSSSSSKHPPCMDTTTMDAEAFLKHLRSFPRYQGRVVHVHHLPQRTAQYGTPVPPLREAILVGLKACRGIHQLYTHQARAITALRASQDTVIATSTASGKSLCYTIPIFEAIASDPDACAILMYPTKALAQDQLRALRDLAAACFSASPDKSPIIEIYDGDTPVANRGEVRDRAQILLTNPDMLHVSILPAHAQFRRILSNLSYVVIDEAHMYRGVFGAHVAMVIRRLRRICEKLYSKRPTFALTTATVANPGQHAASLLGLPDADGHVTVVGASPEEDGSPRGEKHFVLWNPPLVTPNPSPNLKNKRVAQEAGREAVRRARQARHAPPLLGTSPPTRLSEGEGGVGDDADASWLNAVALGRRKRGRVWNLNLKRPCTATSEATVDGARSDQHLSLRENLLQVGRSRYGAAGVDVQDRRTSPIVEISILLSECVQHGLRTIAFCKTRKLSELVTAYVREILLETAPHLVESAVAVYRSGYSPEERREIEDGLFRGRLLAVAATNALELGVDVGGLDVTLHLGFPGSIASLWQQAGRAGRRERASVSVYVGWDGPLDQYFMNNPSKLFGRPIEAAAVDPKNNAVLESHLACAAAELPLTDDAAQVQDVDLFGGKDVFTAALGALRGKGIVGRHPNVLSAWHFTGGHYYGNNDNPAYRITLRAIDPGRYAIIDESQDGKVLEEVEENKAFYQVYDGAVYMFQGRTYLCKKLDLDAKVAIVRPADLKYYTKPVDFTRVTVVGGEVAYRYAGHQVCSTSTNDDQHSTGGSCSGKALVTTKWMGFVRIWRGSGQVFDSVDLFLPDVAYETEATYIRLGPRVRRAVEAAGLPFRDGIHAASHAILNALPLFLMCNPQDVGTECDNPYDTQYKPERLLVFDKHPGGIGLAVSASRIFGDLLRAALKLINQCDCTSMSGCPGCIQHLDCGEYNAVLHKESGRIILEEALSGIFGCTESF